MEASPPAGLDRERGLRLGTLSGRRLLVLGAALLFLAGAVGYFLGTTGDDGPGRDSVDVGFLEDMIRHHEQAIELSNVELVKGAEPGVQTFAREILYFQAYELGLMEQKLAEWGHDVRDRPDTAMAWMGTPVPLASMPGLATEEELDALSDASGRAVDALFVPLMQDHHRGGVHMAEHVAEHAEDPFVRRIARIMARNQRVEIRELADARQRTGLPENPPGYESDDI